MVDNFINKWLNNFNKYEAKAQGKNITRSNEDEASIGTNIVISINNKSNPSMEAQKSVPNFKVSTKEISGSYNNGDKNSESVVPQIEVRTVISVPALNTAAMKRDLEYEDKKSPSGTPRSKLPFGPLTTRAIVDLTGDEESNSVSPRTGKSDYGNGDLGDLIAMVGDDIHLPSQYGDQLSEPDEDDQADFEEDEPEPAPSEDNSKFIQLEQQVQELQKRISELELQQQNRSRAESDLRQLNLSLIKQVQRLKDNNGDLKDENEDLQQQLNELRESHLLMMTEKSIQALNQHEEIDRLNEVITSQRNSHLELSRMNDELHTQCTRLQNANNKLRDQLLDVLQDDDKTDKAKLAILKLYLQGEHGTNTPPAQKKMMVSFTGSDETHSNARSTPNSPAQVQAERTRKHQRHLAETPLSTPASPNKRKSSKEDGSTSPRKAKRSLSVKKGTKM